MCFEFDSVPPIAPVSGASVERRRFTLRSGDGTEFLAYSAAAGTPGTPGIVVLPDVRGLYPFYEQLADRLAERGYDAVAVDYFGRTAGTGDRDADFDFWPHVHATTAEGVTGDVRAGIAHLREMGDADRPIFTIGFCFGGSNSWLQAAAGHGLSGAIGFYGKPLTAREGSPAPVDLVDDYECPVLCLMGGDDPAIPEEDVSTFAAALESAGVDHEVKVYAGAPHSFFDRHFEEHAAASADAWERVLAFIQRNAG